jgi:tetratricopeptide (TPR) repeat protein
LKSLKPLYSLAFKDFAAKPLKCLPGKAFKDFRAYYPTTLLHQGQAETALDIWEQAQRLYEQAGDRSGALGSQINQTQALQSLGFYQQARQRLEDLNQELAALPDSDLKISGLRSLGTALQVIGDVRSSYEVLEQSLAIARRMGATNELSSALLNIRLVAE